MSDKQLRFDESLEVLALCWAESMKENAKLRAIAEAARRWATAEIGDPIDEYGEAIVDTLNAAGYLKNAPC